VLLNLSCVTKRGVYEIAEVTSQASDQIAIHLYLLPLQRNS